MSFQHISLAAIGACFLRWLSGGGKVPLVAMLVHVAAVEVMDALGFYSVLPLVYQKALVRLDTLNILWVAVREGGTEIPAEYVGGLLLFLLLVPLLLGYRAYCTRLYCGRCCPLLRVLLLFLKLIHLWPDESFKWHPHRNRSCIPRTRMLLA